MIHMGITCETHVIFMCFFRKGYTDSGSRFLQDHNFHLAKNNLFMIITIKSIVVYK